MSKKLNGEILETPFPEQLSYHDVLSQYGLSMEYVQQFEHTLKSILFLSKVLNVSNSSSLSDEFLEESIGETGKRTLGQTLNEIRKRLPEFNLQPFPESMDSLLEKMVHIRNRLAHRYLVENSRLLELEDGRRGLILELRWFAQIFATMNNRMERWLNLVLSALGYSREDLDRFEKDLSTLELNDLKSQLQELGIAA